MERAPEVLQSNKKHYMRKIVSIAVIVLLLSLSCTKTQPAGATATVAMSNEWWVTLKLNGADLIGTHVAFSTYNTSSNVSDSLWVDDLGLGYQFKCKVVANPKDLTFSVDSAQNQYYDIRVHIANGKIIKNGGISRTGLTTDSLYMEASFGDDPGDTYIISGTARTRQAADDY
jgi:hypothetical protein